MIEMKWGDILHNQISLKCEQFNDQLQVVMVNTDDR